MLVHYTNQLNYQTFMSKFQRVFFTIDLYFSSNNITVIDPRRMRWIGHVALTGREEMHTGFFMLKPKLKRPLGICKRRLEDNIKIYLKEIGWDDVECIDVAEKSNK